MKVMLAKWKVVFHGTQQRSYQNELYEGTTISTILRLTSKSKSINMLDLLV